MAMPLLDYTFPVDAMYSRPTAQSAGCIAVPPPGTPPPESRPRGWRRVQGHLVHRWPRRGRVCHLGSQAAGDAPSRRASPTPRMRSASTSCRWSSRGDGAHGNERVVVLKWRLMQGCRSPGPVAKDALIAWRLSRSGRGRHLAVDIADGDEWRYENSVHPFMAITFHERHPDALQRRWASCQAGSAAYWRVSPSTGPWTGRAAACATFLSTGACGNETKTTLRHEQHCKYFCWCLRRDETAAIAGIGADLSVVLRHRPAYNYSLRFYSAATPRKRRVVDVSFQSPYQSGSGSLRPGSVSIADLTADLPRVGLSACHGEARSTEAAVARRRRLRE